MSGATTAPEDTAALLPRRAMGESEDDAAAAAAAGGAADSEVATASQGVPSPSVGVPWPPGTPPVAHDQHHAAAAAAATAAAAAATAAAVVEAASGTCRVCFEVRSVLHSCFSRVLQTRLGLAAWLHPHAPARPVLITMAPAAASQEVSVDGGKDDADVVLLGCQCRQPGHRACLEEWCR